MSYRDHAFITMSQTCLTRELVYELLLKNRATLGKIVEEDHDMSAEDFPEHGTGKHIHAAIYGRFRADRLAPSLRRCMPEGAHLSVLFQHPPKDGCKKGASWPFEEMVKYITDPTKMKSVDVFPKYIGCNSDEELHKKYEEANDPDVVLKKLVTMRDDGVTDVDALAYIADIIMCQEDRSFLYRLHTDFWKATVRHYPSLLTNDIHLWPHQQKLIDFCNTPITGDTNCRGVWLDWDSGAGKSHAIARMYDLYGPEQVFQPGVRPNGSYDLISMIGYNGQRIIFLDDVAVHVTMSYEYSRDKNGHNVATEVLTPRPKASFIMLLKRMCDVTPISISFGGKHYNIVVRARVVIAANCILPPGKSPQETVALHRRYISIPYDPKDVHQEYNALYHPDLNV